MSHTFTTYNAFMWNRCLFHLSAWVMLAAICARSVLGAPGIWFEDVRHSPPASESMVVSLAAHVRHRLLAPDDVAAAPLLPASVRDDFYPRLVFLSVSDGVLPAQVVIGSARGFIKAADNAVAELHKRTKADSDSNKPPFKPRWIRIDVPATILLQEKVDLRGLLEYDRSLFGLAFPRQQAIAILPDELIASGAIDEIQALSPQRCKAFIASRMPDFDANSLQLESENATLFRFTTHSVFANRDGVHPLMRGHDRFAKVTHQHLLKSIESASKYLASSANVYGQFDYHYRPQLQSVADEYDMMHHLQAVDVLLQASAITKNPDLLTAAKRAMDFAESKMGQWGQGDKRLPAVVDKSAMKLGHQAAAAIAYASLMKATNDKKYLERVKAFGAAILAAQRDNGSFILCQRFPDGDSVLFDHPEYEGNAMLALMAVNDVDPQQRWLDAAEKAARFLIQVRDKGVPTSQLPQDHRVLVAICQLHAHRKHDWLLVHASKLSDQIGRSQQRSPIHSDWLGGFGSPPQAGPTAQRAIALLAAHALLIESGGSDHRENAITSLDVAIAAIAFTSQCQFLPHNAMYYNDPQRLLGGCRQSLTEPDIRLDDVINQLTSMMELERLMNRHKIESFAVPPAIQRVTVDDQDQSK